jgi:hypothetical protein
MQVTLDANKYDTATLQLSYARATLFCLTCLVTATCDKPNDTIFSDALHAVGSLIEQANEALVC